MLNNETRRLVRWASRLDAIGNARETEASWLLAKALAQAEGVLPELPHGPIATVDPEAALLRWRENMTDGRELPSRDIEADDPAWMHAAQDWSDGPDVFILDRGGASSARAAAALVDAVWRALLSWLQPSPDGAQGGDAMTWVCLWADGLEWCATHTQAEALAEQILDDYRADAASDGWPDEADQVCVLRVVSQSDIVERGEGDDGEEWVDYGMRSVEALGDLWPLIAARCGVAP